MKLSWKYLLVVALFAVAALESRAQYDRDVFLFRGRKALADGKYAQSIENFNILAQLDTTDYWTFFYRGIAKFNLGDIRGARNDFDRAVRINPIFTYGYHYRGITSSRFGEYDKALEDLDTAIKLRPGFTGLYYSRGVTYFLSQQFDKAMEDFNKYIRKEPKDATAYLHRGATRLFLKDTTNALADYNKAVSIDRMEPDAYIRRGRLYAEMNEFEHAIVDLNKAIQLDSSNTYALFNRGILNYEIKDYNAAMRDLNQVLKYEPGNSLTLYNRSLINAQVGDFEAALEDMDRVLNINPRNVLAYYNRASYFMQMERWSDASDDYSKAIELYPDFAKAYLNRSYAENMLGHKKASKRDYDTAQRKIDEYRRKNETAAGSFADTTAKYSSLLGFEEGFVRKDFDDELLQHRDVDIRLKPLYRFVLSKERGNVNMALSNRYEDPLSDRFISKLPVPVAVANTELTATGFGDAVYASGNEFLIGLGDVASRQYNSALVHYDKAVSGAENSGDDRYAGYYKAYYLLNRAVLRAEMIDFIASIDNNVQSLTMDAEGTMRAKASDSVKKTYDYGEAISDLEEARSIAPNPYIDFNLGNLYCLSSRMLEALEGYDRAIQAWPAMGDAYFNRGLVLIYLKDKEKGCIDFSRAGELGVAESYSVIKKYCKEEQ